MKKIVSSSNLALRFYKCHGWNLDCLEKYLISGSFYDTEIKHNDRKESAYFILEPGSTLDIEKLYEEEVSQVFRAFNDYPLETDLQFMKRHAW